MTDMDWAKSIAIDLDNEETMTDEIAAALRKAKAEGMIACAEYFENFTYSKEIDTTIFRNTFAMAAEEFRQAASKLTSTD